MWYMSVEFTCLYARSLVVAFSPTIATRYFETFVHIRSSISKVFQPILFLNYLKQCINSFVITASEVLLSYYIVVLLETVLGEW